MKPPAAHIARRLAFVATVATVAVSGCNDNSSVDGDRALATPAAKTAEAECRRDYIAAGILPYVRRNDRIFVLLGEEPRSAGPVWTDFVGTRKDRDCAPAVTAAREFSEESRGAYPSAQTLDAIRNVEPIEIERPRVYFWILEVPDISSVAMESGPVAPNSEKHHYCWLDLQRLLDNVDNDERRVPRDCGGHSTRLYDVFENNIVRGGVARAQLESILRR